MNIRDIIKAQAAINISDVIKAQSAPINIRDIIKAQAARGRIRIQLEEITKNLINSKKDFDKMDHRKSEDVYNYLSNLKLATIVFQYNTTDYQNKKTLYIILKKVYMSMCIDSKDKVRPYMKECNTIMESIVHNWHKDPYYSRYKIEVHK